MRPIAALISALVISIGSASAADLVIIAASDAGDQFTPGAILQSEQVLKVPVGGRLTLLAESGAIIKLDGPYSGPAHVPNSSVGTKSIAGWSAALTKIAGLVSKDKKQSTVIGASRYIAPPLANLPDAWAMAVDSSGHRCVRADNVDMWRRKASARADLALRSKSARQTGLVWAAGHDRMALPQQFVEDGTLIVMNIGTEPRRFIMHVLPLDIDPMQPGAVLLWMIDNKCDRQAHTLIRRLHAAVPQ